ncbi:MAG: hypothetical protein WDA16_12380 [Candidatus Thermoplasmatota archaeon]
MPESPKRTEVTEEVKERLEVLELDHTPRAEKLAREAQWLEEASEVRYSERAFRPRHGTKIGDVRAVVDKLGARPKRELPPVPGLPASPAALPKQMREEHRRALEPIIQGELVWAETLYRTGTGEVVDATIAQDGERRVATYIIEDGRARPMMDVESNIDALPAPKRKEKAPAEPSVGKPAKRRFGFGKK